MTNFLRNQVRFTYTCSIPKRLLEMHVSGSSFLVLPHLFFNVFLKVADWSGEFAVNSLFYLGNEGSDVKSETLA